MSGFPPWFQIVDRNGIVARALAGTVDRTEPDGRAWCSPRVAASLIDLVVERDANLPSALQGVVRLARLLQWIDGRHYWAPLYRGQLEPFGIHQLTTQAFRSLVTQATNSGRINAAVATVTQSGVTFLEPELCTRAGPVVQLATLSYTAMPVLSGLLTTLHEALGLHVVAGLLQPMLTPGRPTLPAFEIANELTRHFDRWLTGNLDTAHHMRQARAMRAFLALRELYDPTLIDDATILAFWQEQARRQVDADVDGFRLFKSAARKMINYRDQMRSVAASDGLAAPLDITTIPPAAISMASGRDLDDNDYQWRSPLAELASAPADRIKWLTNTERQQLAHYLGGLAHSDLEGDGTASIDPGRRSTVGGAAPSLRYDLSLWRTLLRVDVFGDVQAKLTQRLRDAGHAASDIDASLNAVPCSAYAEVLATYRTIRAQIRLAMLAALDVQAPHGVAVAALLLESVGNSAACDELRGLVSALLAETQIDRDGADGEPDPQFDLPSRITDVVGRALQNASQLSDAQSAAALGALMHEAKRARKTIRRRGFGIEADGMLDSFKAATEPLIRLLRELDRLIAALDQSGRVETVDFDRTKFLETFQLLYGATVDRVG